MEACSYNGWRFWRRPVPASNAAERARHACPLVTCSAFTFAGAYRDSARYARGLQDLCEAVRLHLPGFALRVYCDGSIDPAALRASGREEAGDAWEAALSHLAAQPHASVVWFEHAAFLTHSGSGGGGGGGGGGGDGSGSGAQACPGGHVDLFGTFARFVPLFECGGSGLPAWAGSPPEGTVVFSSDVDFGDFATEHLMLHGLQWLQQGGAPGAGPPRPAVLGLAASGSAAARHAPCTALPPIYSGLLATRTRFPLAWLDAFLKDAATHAATGDSALLSRFLAAVHDPARRNATYDKRRIASQQLMPFGIDEFFFTNAVVPRAIAAGMGGAPAPASWLFLIIPTVDAEVGKLLALVKASGLCIGGSSASASASAREMLHRLLGGLARAAGKEKEWSAASPSAPPLPSAAALEQWAESWPRAAAARLGLWSRHRGSFDVLAGSASRAVAEGLGAAFVAALELAASGALAHSGEDLEQITQNVAHLGGAAPELCAVAEFQVGGGYARRVEGGCGAVALLAALQAPGVCSDCAVPRCSAMSGSGSGGAVGAPSQEEREQAGGGAHLPASLKRPRQEAEGEVGGSKPPPPQPQALAPPPPPPQQQQQQQQYPGWSFLLSKSQQRHYYFHAATSTSAWHDDALPAGWAWAREKEGMPKYYLHLVTGERRATPP